MAHLFSSEDQDNSALDFNFKIAKLFILIFFSILVGRLWYLQIVHGEEFRLFSNKNLLKSSDVFAPRGIVYDRDGKILAENLPAYKAVIIPQYVDDLDSLAKDLSPALQMTPKDIVKKVRRSRRQNGRFYPVDIKLHLSRDELFDVELIKLDHSGLRAEEFILRHYPYGPEMAHTLGYVREISKNELPRLADKYGNKAQLKARDIIGKKGIEEAFDLVLRGKKGKSFVIVDAKGQKRSENTMKAIGEILKNTPSEPGANIHTTIDVDLQKLASETFRKFERVGSLIAMTPEGEILAWVSYPSFDPNFFSKRVSPEVWKKWMNNDDRPLTNKAIQDHYSPGSTFKPIVALSALQNKIIRANQYVHAPSKFKLGRRTWHDHTQSGQGYIEVREALERSSNVFFYKTAVDLGPDNMAKYAQALGLGQKTGIPISGEVKGHVPTRDWKKKRWGEPWQPGESVNMSIGQGHVLVTTIQQAQAYSAIAMNGAVYKPQIIKRMTMRDPETNRPKTKVFEPILLRNLSKEKEAPYYIEPKHFKTVKEGLWKVVNGKKGTAKKTRFEKPFSVSGKTGTAQVRRFAADQLYKKCSVLPKKHRHNGWFIGYGSVEGVPKVTIAVFTEHSCTSAAAVPIAREVFAAYFKKYHNMRLDTDNEKS